MLLSNWQPLRPDLEKRPNVPAKCTRHRLWRTKNCNLRLFILTSNHLTTTRIGHNSQNAISSNVHSSKKNPGGKVQATILTRTGRRAFSARDKVTVKKSAASVKKPTSLVWTPTVVRSGPRSTPRRATRLTTWTFLPSRSRIFSEELDGTPTSSSSSHSSADFKFVCHLCRDIQ